MLEQVLREPLLPALPVCDHSSTTSSQWALDKAETVRHEIPAETRMAQSPTHAPRAVSAAARI